MLEGIHNAIENATGYLLDRQHDDGHWEDFELPVGRSDSWVTAYIGLTLVSADRISKSSDALTSATRAATWLCRHRYYASGWGYNAVTGPDADSTGYVLRLFGELGYSVRRDDERWLLDRWQPDGGFATYDGPGGWGIAHPDVTPVAFWALSREHQIKLVKEVAAYLLRTRSLDGTWPSYWWRTRHYSTALNIRLARQLGLGIKAVPVVAIDEDLAIYSAFDLICVSAIALLNRDGFRLTLTLLSELLKMQDTNGYWPGGKNLRVTRHDAEKPWENPKGELYPDNEHLFTTASAVRMLSEAASLWTTRS